MSRKSHLVEAGARKADAPSPLGRLLQRRAARETDSARAGTRDVPQGVRDVLQGPGRPLEEGVRAQMEPHFGQDFSRVRVHTDTGAADSARSVGALAYTVGQHVVFGAGQYAPGTDAGRGLIAHELTHVVQQSRGASTEGGDSSSDMQAEARFEREADAASRAVSDGRRADVRERASATGGVARLRIQRFSADEHRLLGDEATQGANVNLGGDAKGDEFWLSHGDVIALSGDYFEPADLMRLGRIPGLRGQYVGTRDEIIWALKDIDGSKNKDPRFLPGGKWYTYEFSDKVKAAVTERFDRLAAANTSHFVAPRGRDKTGALLPLAPGDPSAGGRYHRFHRMAIEEAYTAGQNNRNIGQAMAWEAAAQHYLTDAFSAGHARTPIASIREYWGNKYPLFWYNLRHKMALDTAAQINRQHTNLTTVFGSVQTIYENIITKVEELAAALPPITLGDLLALVFHDYDNEHGLNIVGGGRIYGDDQLLNKDPANVTRDRAVKAIVAGNLDVAEAYNMGKAGTQFPNNNALVEAIRLSSKAPPGIFLAESMIPTPDNSNPDLNWKASSIETLWNMPMAGTSGPTVGSQIAASLQPGQTIRNKLENLAKKFDEVQHRGSGDVKPRKAYLDGFVAPIVNNPYKEIVNLIHWVPNYGLSSKDRDDISREVVGELTKQGKSKDMTLKARAGYIKELTGGSVGGGEEEMIVQLFREIPPAERPVLYKMVEGHDWTGDWIHGVFTWDDEIWNALDDETRLNTVRKLINEGWSGKKK